MDLLFATSNQNKLKEVRMILGAAYKVVGLEDISFNDEIPEPYDTIELNSIFKAQYFKKKTGLNCLAEDSGLEVDALDGRPGVYSARYAGEDRSDQKNMDKVLMELAVCDDRGAQFKSVFTWINDDFLIQFTGITRGQIIHEKRGTDGFGYDPIFVPEGYQTTYAEMGYDEKNKISHRKKSLAKFIDFIAR
jgi:XTP/dITP diphosphohydrolase